MTDLLLHLDPEAILKNGKSILRHEGQLPEDCPSPDKCLSFGAVSFARGLINLRIDAQPPELPTTREGMKYETHPTCASMCGILGNPNHCFKITQDEKTGKIRRAEGVWQQSP